MRKKSLAEKMAEKAFNNADIQKSWLVHMAAFGPILESAFAEDFAARIHLTAALNNISRKEIPQALEKLKKIQKDCKTDSDKAAWLFFAGLALEMAGNTQQAVMLYRDSNEFHHRFYMPYLKVAKLAHSDGMYEIAEENYRAAMDCFQATGLDDQSRTILTSVNINLATCLIMMQRLEDAENALAVSHQLMPDNPARSATEAVLCAVRGQEAEAKRHLTILENYYPPALEHTAQEVQKILEGKHPQFFSFPMDESDITAFWQWFVQNEAMFRECFAKQDHDSVLNPLTEQFRKLFSFYDSDPDFGILIDDGHYIMELADHYAVSLRSSYDVLLQSCPAEVKKHWQFQIIH